MKPLPATENTDIGIAPTTAFINLNSVLEDRVADTTNTPEVPEIVAYEALVAETCNADADADVVEMEEMLVLINDSP